MDIGKCTLINMIETVNACLSNLGNLFHCSDFDESNEPSRH